MTPQITLVGDGKTTVVTAQGPITLTVDDSPSTPTPTPPIQPPDPTPTPPSGGVPGGPALPVGNFSDPLTKTSWKPIAWSDFDKLPVPLGRFGDSGKNSAVATGNPGAYNGNGTVWCDGTIAYAGNNNNRQDTAHTRGQGKGMLRNDRTVCISGPSDMTVAPSDGPSVVQGLVLPKSCLGILQYVPNTNVAGLQGVPLGANVAVSVPQLNFTNKVGQMSPFFAVFMRLRIVNWGATGANGPAGHKNVPLFWPVGAGGYAEDELDLAEWDYDSGANKQGSFATCSFHPVTGSPYDASVYYTNTGANGAPKAVIPGPPGGPYYSAQFGSNAPRDPKLWDGANWHTYGWLWYDNGEHRGLAGYVDGQQLFDLPDGTRINCWNSGAGTWKVPTSIMMYQEQAETTTVGNQPGPGNWEFVQQDWIEIYKQA